MHARRRCQKSDHSSSTFFFNVQLSTIHQAKSSLFQPATGSFVFLPLPVQHRSKYGLARETQRQRQLAVVAASQVAEEKESAAADAFIGAIRGGEAGQKEAAGTVVDWKSASSACEYCHRRKSVEA
ncbi:hypothetical protein HO173_003189 [Letharia columbiana]|uniref:Uncharacterized protein n=1 Tax=Letharia columbiana TaxID=112416 RepID=A0A8H6G1A3_9LECA|nr:uncharacterized protein HO173_003189 [Letharia columbiana]KAF6238683.1 hypothetical protein HO173_003189 [Letharia columbiana]